MEILCKNFPKSQTWNWIFFQLSKKNRECSKISHIYLLWTSSERSLSKIRGPFFPKKKASPRGCFWQKIPKISEIFNLKLDFFPTFQKKSRMFQKISNLFTLNLIWANFEQDQSTFFFEKKGLCSSVNLKKKSKNSRIFQLEIGFFSDFAKKTSNVPKNSKFICSELHLSQFSAKL